MPESCVLLKPLNLSLMTRDASAVLSSPTVPVIHALSYAYADTKCSPS